MKIIIAIMNARIMTKLLAVMLVGSLAACGGTQFERTASGAGMGAAIGAGVGALTGHTGAGAAIGAGAGAIGGALSPPPQGPVYPTCPYRDQYGYCVHP